MLTTTFEVVVGIVIAAEAAAESTHRITCYPDWPLISLASTGMWLTIGAILVVAGFHLFPRLRRWIAEQRAAWSLRHAPTRSRPRHSAYRP